MGLENKSRIHKQRLNPASRLLCGLGVWGFGDLGVWGFGVFGGLGLGVYYTNIDQDDAGST